jgi:hypothetical protein
MLNAPRWRVSLLTTGLAFLSFAGALTGCRAPQMKPPVEHVSPYNTSGGDVLWAVAPLRNETGTSFVDVEGISDRIVMTVDQVRGIRCLPLNRTLVAMRALELTAIESPDQMKRLATELGADGVIVGSVTAYDPYTPPTLGLALALYAKPGHLDRLGQTLIDTRRLEYQPTDYQYFRGSNFNDAPVSVISATLDARNHGVQMRVEEYATGRSDPVSALGWRTYLMSMDLYTEFAAWHAVGRLLDHEWLRLSRQPVRSASGSP